jgi:heterodisulfide reductase subunit B
MRALQLGQEDIALQSQTIWLCASCQTCATRCPQGLDITAIMEFLSREALARGHKPAVSEVKLFGQAFMREVNLWGRAYELGLMAEMKLRTLNISQDMDLAVKMIAKNKISFVPHPSRAPRNAKPLPGAATAIAYYPGCSLHSTATEYDASTRAVCQALGLRLIEPHGWQCCGSSAAHRADPEAALRLPLTNLALIEQNGFKEVAMPCAACFNRHQAALHEIRHNSERRLAVEKRIGYEYQDSVRVRSLAESVLHHVGKEGISGKVQKPLKGLRVVCYYGCLLTRPPQITESLHPENPMELDEIMTALGAEVLDWSYKTTCCGAAHSLIRREIVLNLSGRLIEGARQSGADLIAVACPLCHANLDARQFQMKLDFAMPVMYFTQLMALALGLPEKTAVLSKNMVDPRPLLRSRNFLQPT